MPFALRWFLQPSATAVLFVPGGGRGEPCPNVCTEVPAATSQLRFLPYEISSCPFLVRPRGLGNNNIGGPVFFLYKKKIIQAG